VLANGAVARAHGVSLLIHDKTARASPQRPPWSPEARFRVDGTCAPNAAQLPPGPGGISCPLAVVNQQIRSDSPGRAKVRPGIRQPVDLGALLIATPGHIGD